MKRLIRCAVLGLAACLLVQPSATADRQMVRPHKYWASMVLMVNIDPDSPDYGYTEYFDVGFGTHLGQATNYGTGHMDFTTGAWTATGTVTASDGSLLHWEVNGVIGPDLVVSVTSGTDRFEGASGELNSWVFGNQVDVIEWPYMITTNEAVATGWISY